MQSTGVNVALSFEGLSMLGAEGLAAFPSEFQAGMRGRAVAIGDVEDSDPQAWLAPFTPDGTVHAMLIMAADTPDDLDDRTDRLTAIMQSTGVNEVGRQDGNVRPDAKRGHEHFGFKDGISQPSIKGLTRSSKGGPDIAAGEFLIGYLDQDGNDSGEWLPQAPAEGTAGYDPSGPPPPPQSLPPWARNGSFVVYRRLQQDVRGFCDFLDQQSPKLQLDVSQLRAKLVGRWPSGAPLERVVGEHKDVDPTTTDPSIADPVVLHDDHINAFEYQKNDADGNLTPRAAHIRKSYPRDEEPPGDAEADRHRILRRGIPYGPELAPEEPPYPGGGRVPDEQDRGLLFICLVTIPSVRIANTATGLGSLGSTPFSIGETRSLLLTGSAGIPSNGVSGVVLEIVASGSSSSGSLSLYRDDVAKPGTTDLSYASFSTASDFAIVAVGSDGGIDVTSNAGNPNVQLAVEGYFTKNSGTADAGGYVPVSESRILDTSATPIQPGQTIALTVGGNYGVPSGSNAIFGNLAIHAIDGGSGGLDVWPSSQSEPALTTVKWGSLWTSSGATVALGTSGVVEFHNTGDHAIVVTFDLDGYFANGSATAGTGFFTSSDLLYDSSSPGATALAGNLSLTIGVAGAGPNEPYPSAMQAAALDLAVSGATSSGQLTAYPSDSAEPPTTNLSYEAGESSSVLTFTATGSDGSVTIHNSGTSSVSMTVGIEGWFAADQSQNCAADDVTEAGACTVPQAPPDLQASQTQQLADKDSAYTSALSEIQAQDANPNSPCCGGSGGQYKIPAVVDMNIIREGQGDIDPKYGRPAAYTCGPAATRNMINAMNKSYHGSYQAPSEQTIASWEGTTRNGTSAAEVRNALNAHYPNEGQWSTHRATSGDDYLSHVAVDTYQYHQSVIVNIQTDKLPFWNGKSLGHFDFDYGFNSTDPTARTIAIGEEWDPIFVGSPAVPVGGVERPVMATRRAASRFLDCRGSATTVRRTACLGSGYGSGCSASSMG